MVHQRQGQKSLTDTAGQKSATEHISLTFWVAEVVLFRSGPHFRRDRRHSSPFRHRRVLWPLPPHFSLSNPRTISSNRKYFDVEPGKGGGQVENNSLGYVFEDPPAIHNGLEQPDVPTSDNSLSHELGSEWASEWASKRTQYWRPYSWWFWAIAGRLIMSQDLMIHFPNIYKILGRFEL